jgi:DNA-binding NarL/FixJ family response regulator
LATSSIRVLVVDDFEPFRRLLFSTIQDELDLPTIAEASDGAEAVEVARAMRPDLILLDIGLPKVDGIEAARRIRELVPQTKILFVSQELSVEVVQAAFGAGASGYLAKMDVGSELPTALKTVLRGDSFVGSRFDGHGFTEASGAQKPERALGNKAFGQLQRQNIEIPRCHEVGFYSDDARLLDAFTQFIGTALKAGNAAIVVATDSHRNSLLSRLQAPGLDIGSAIEQGRYVSLDAAEMLSEFMVNGMPDPVRFLKVVGDLLLNTAKAAKGEQPRIAACGECAPLLWAQGKAEAAIQLEHLWDEIAKSYDVDVLCGYFLGTFQARMGSYIFDKLCEAHSAVRSR